MRPHSVPFLRLFVLLALVGGLPPAAATPFAKVVSGGPASDLVAVQGRDGLGLLRVADGTTLSLAPEGRLASFRTEGTRWWVGAVVHLPERESLALFTGDGLEKPRRLPEPAVGGPLTMGPTILADGAEPRWVLWLEGSDVDRMAVRAARWTGVGWEESRTVSPSGPGTQIALDAVRTADGWLAVWAAYDGEDDEILWSRGTDRGWTAPLPVEADDLVPDITPSLAVDDSGPVLVWSELDGDEYRSRFARFDGTAWSDPVSPGPLGTVGPRLAARDGHLLLVELGASPRAWWITDLAADGSPVRRSRIEALSLGTPRLELVADEELVVAWPSAAVDGGWRAVTGSWEALATER